jgi:hypothetical protein
MLSRTVAQAIRIAIWFQSQLRCRDPSLSRM